MYSPLGGPHLVVNVLVGDHLVLVACHCLWCHCLWCQSSAIEIGPLQSTRIHFFSLLRRLPCRRSIRILLVVVIGSIATNVSKYQYIYLHHAFTYLILWLALEVDITRALIGIILSYMSTGRFKGLQKQYQMSYNKQLINLERSVLTRKSQTSSLTYWPRYRSVPVPQGLGLTFSRFSSHSVNEMLKSQQRYLLAISLPPLFRQIFFPLILLENYLCAAWRKINTKKWITSSS